MTRPAGGIDPDGVLPLHCWDEPGLEHDLRHADRPVAAHRCLPRRVEEEDADIPVFRGRGCKDAPKHIPVTPRFPNDQVSDPVKVVFEPLASFEHCLSLDQGQSRGDDADGLPCRVGVDDIDDPLKAKHTLSPFFLSLDLTFA